MKYKRITGLLALLMLSTAGYAQSTDLTRNGDGTWTLAAMPDYDVGLQVEYEDDTSPEGGFAFILNADGTWTMDGMMPDYDVGLQVEYEDDTSPEGRFAFTLSADGTWTMDDMMPDYDLELQVEYEDETSPEGEFAFALNTDGTWTMDDVMPDYDLELLVEYEDDTTPEVEFAFTKNADETWTMDDVMPDCDLELVVEYENLEPLMLKDAEDNTSTLAANNGVTTDVSIEGRTIYGDRWNTLCLPFDLDAEQIGQSSLAGFEVKELDTENNASYEKVTGYEAEKKTLWLNFKDAASIEAGKPYLVKTSDGNGDIVNPMFEDVVIKNDTPASIVSHDGTVTFLGTYAPVVFKKDEENKSVLFLQNNLLYYPDGLEQTTIKAFRAYFPLNGIHGAAIGNGDIKAFVLNFGDESTVVEMINGEMVNGKSDGWYDVSGRKLSQRPQQRGIYIYNGRKVLVNKK